MILRLNIFKEKNDKASKAWEEQDIRRNSLRIEEKRKSSKSAKVEVYKVRIIYKEEQLSGM